MHWYYYSYPSVNCCAGHSVQRSLNVNVRSEPEWHVSQVFTLEFTFEGMVK
jgi:hypothetical protein